MEVLDPSDISVTFEFYNNLINRRKTLKGALNMSVLQVIDLKKYYGKHGEEVLNQCRNM